MATIRTASQLIRRTALCAVVVIPLQVLGQVYVGSAPNTGTIVLSNFQSQATPDLLLALPVPESVGKTKTPAEPHSGQSLVIPAKAAGLAGMIESVAKSVSIAPQLIHAVISAESNYEARAVSPRGAIGLMQLMPATAKRFGVKDPFAERDNVYGGASYLKWLMGYFNGDIELVLAAYNAGEQAVVKAGHKVPQYPETQAYVRRIMANLNAAGSLPM